MGYNKGGKTRTPLSGFFPCPAPSFGHHLVRSSPSVEFRIVSESDGKYITSGMAQPLRPSGWIIVLSAGRASGVSPSDQFRFLSGQAGGGDFRPHPGNRPWNICHSAPYVAKYCCLCLEPLLPTGQSHRFPTPCIASRPLPAMNFYPGDSATHVALPSFKKKTKVDKREGNDKRIPCAQTRV